MEIRFIGKHMTVPAAVKEHLEEKLVKLEKYASRLVESQIVLKKEKYLLKAEITVFGKDLRIYGEGESKENLFSATDQAYTRVEKQLKKFREKTKAHHPEHGDKGTPLKVKTAESLNKNSERSNRPAIMQSEKFAVKPMSAEEASMQLNILERSFLVFSNAATQKVNVIYRMSDGNHGLIEPEFS